MPQKQRIIKFTKSLGPPHPPPTQIWGFFSNKTFFYWGASLTQYVTIRRFMTCSRFVLLNAMAAPQTAPGLPLRARILWLPPGSGTVPPTHGWETDARSIIDQLTTKNYLLWPCLAARTDYILHIYEIILWPSRDDILLFDIAMHGALG